MFLEVSIQNNVVINVSIAALVFMTTAIKIICTYGFILKS